MVGDVALGLILSIASGLIAHVITVLEAQDELGVCVPGVELGVPLPRMAIPTPLGAVMPVVQVHDPAGILIVSPFTAVCVGPLMTAFTSA